MWRMAGLPRWHGARDPRTPTVLHNSACSVELLGLPRENVHYPYGFSSKARQDKPQRTDVWRRRFFEECHIYRNLSRMGASLMHRRELCNDYVCNASERDSSTIMRLCYDFL
ncbi:hypothetical protein BIFGAL_04129 [Bifidobacterium gallicum DSM 20093 = LMG 11596]|uniref:Uncharacterized protein n=1 Tax=Bifidobacterium gallicum DSM 20093 = LMG 11596 TaxID=561180 RepID=D1NW82_9BIFI|nr:hypothetical protein BIFGAL_04129 [Bifidobacterium gallicum DSM 20093 = LMG 11596]